jgi:hypothetical protein
MTSVSMKTGLVQKLKPWSTVSFPLMGGLSRARHFHLEATDSRYRRRAAGTGMCVRDGRAAEYRIEPKAA